MEYRILGPVEVWRDARHLSLGGPKQRSLLAILFLHANHVVARDRLINLLWEDALPEAAVNSCSVGLSLPQREAMCVCCAVMGLACIAAAEGKAARALRIQADVMQLIRKWQLHTGRASSPLYTVFNRFLSPAREALDQPAQDRVAIEGSRISEEQAIEYALSDRD